LWSFRRPLKLTFWQYPNLEFPGELFHSAQKSRCLIGRIVRKIFNEV
jgi:hypothetical protein